MTSKIFLLFLNIILISALFFPQPVFAFWDWIVGALTFLPSLFIIIIIQLAILVAGLLASIASALVRWVASPGFTTLPYTRPGPASQGGNPIIEIGLSITQGFVNMGLVLVLVFIAFATILRLPDYDPKRLLVKFLIAALLVNFAPTICGLIVDAFNIVMNFFAEKLDGLTILTNTFRSIGDNLWHAIRSLRVTDQVVEIVGGLIFFIFNLFLALILFLFAFLFAARYVAIWLAVILSPIAFVCWILPATKRWWNWWWENFIQWAMIGVVTAFFLYLGAQIAGIVGEVDEQNNLKYFSAPEIAGFLPRPGLFNKVLIHFLTLASLYLGLALGLKTNALGTESIINFARRAPSWVSKTTLGRKVLGRAASGTSQALGKVGQYAQRLEMRARKIPIIGPAAGLSLRTVGQISQAGVPPLLKYAVRARKAEIPSNFGEMSVMEQERYVSSLLSMEDRIQFAAEMKKLGTLQKTSKDFQENIIREAQILAQNPSFKKETGAIFDAFPNKITKEAKIALKVTPETPPEKARKEIEAKIKPIIEDIEAEAKINPQLNIEIEKRMEETGKSRKETVADIATGVLHVRGMAPKDIPHLAPSALDSIVLRWGMHGATPSKINQIFENFDRETAEKVLEGPGGFNQLFENLKNQPEKQKELLIKLHQENESLLRWFSINPTGRVIKFTARDILEREYGNYENFLKEMRKLEKIKIMVPPEKVEPKEIKRYEKRPLGRGEAEGKVEKERKPPGREE